MLNYICIDIVSHVFPFCPAVQLAHHDIPVQAVHQVHHVNVFVQSAVSVL